MSQLQLKIQLLRMLAELQPVEDVDFRPIEGWITKIHLGAAMFELLGKNSRFNYLKAQEQYYTNIFRSTVQQTVFSEIVTALNQKNIEILLLKGAAITPIAWDQPYLRYQADIDFMVRREALGVVSQHLQQAGFVFSKPKRVGRHFSDLPETNKEGQLELVSTDGNSVNIEVHSEVFLGHLQRLTTNRHEDDLWGRKVSAGQTDNTPLWRLSNEDLLLHILVHTAINHQFDQDAARNFIDLIRLANRLTVDWELLFERIRQRKVTAAVWLTLALMQDIFGTTSYTSLLNNLGENVWRSKRWLLKKLIDKELILMLYTIKQTRWRYALLLLMVDRIGDMLRLLMRLPKLEKS